MVKKEIAEKVRLHLTHINMLLDTVRDLKLEIDIKIFKNKDGQYRAKITEEL